jgi:hypothetical protein
MPTSPKGGRCPFHLGHEPPFKCGVARTFKGRLHPVTGHPIVKDERSVVGHCRHWGEPGSTSAMRRIADSGGIEQRNGSFLHQRTHAPDPLPPVARSGIRGQLWE